MQVIKENKVLMLWWAVAYVAAFSGYYKGSYENFNESSIFKADTLIYFSFSEFQKSELANYFDEKYEKHGFNGVVLIGQKDSIFYSNYYGYANYEKRDTLNLNSSFELASVSKQFTAVAILQLYEKGLLNLSDSIQKFYPEFPNEGITIHHLLTHRSGLANYHYFMKKLPVVKDTVSYNQAFMYEFIKESPRAYYRPDRRYHYSNSGYAILASIVECVSGLPYNTYLNQNIFIPLNMTESFTYNDKANGNSATNTQGYVNNQWRLAENNYLDHVLGDKGIFCSATDLFKWDQGLYKNIIINIDTLHNAFKPLGKPQNFKSNYGYGWRMFDLNNDSIKVLFHGGWWHGYKTLLMRIQHDSTTIVVLKNRSRGAAINSNHILQILYPDVHAISDSVAVEVEE